MLNTTEIWELINLTEDSHPDPSAPGAVSNTRPAARLIHFQFHGQRNRALHRSSHTTSTQPRWGWKDTVRADPGLITRIIIPFEGYAGRYVWHCHILEHEDNEMMRPYEVVAG